MRDNVDFALALDWYKVPQDGVESKDWPNTDLGELVHKGKYWYTDPKSEQRKQRGRALVERLVELIDRHPLLRDVDRVASVPGHDPAVVSFAGQLSNSVALALGKPFVRCTGPSSFRTPAKELDRTRLVEAISNKFVCAADLQGQSVLVVDDVYRTGSTMAEVARAVRCAGAERVMGLCPVRTMSS